MIKKIIAESGAEVEVDDSGNVNVSGLSEEGVNKAIEMIENLVKEVLPGEIYTGTVKRMMNFGAFVEILPNHDGLVHISELALERIPDIRDVITEGDTLKVRIIDIDANDRIKLSRRVILEDEMRARGEEIPEREAAPPRDSRGGRPGGRGRDDRRGGGRERRPRRD